MEGFTMMEDFYICKVYLNSEEDEFNSKEAIHSFGTIIGFMEKMDGDNVAIEYLVEPISYRINNVDKYIEEYNVTWISDYTEFIDEKPEYLRMMADKTKVK
jgi:hypothetical protein